MIGTTVVAVAVYQWLTHSEKDSEIASELMVYNTAIECVVHDCSTALDYYIPSIQNPYDDILIDECIDIMDCGNTLYDRHKKILALWKSLKHFEQQMFEPNQWTEMISHISTYVELTQAVPTLVPKPFTLKDLNDMVVVECEAVVNGDSANDDVVNMCKLVLASQSDYVRMGCIQKLNELLKGRVGKKHRRLLSAVGVYIANMARMD